MEPLFPWHFLSIWTVPLDCLALTWGFLQLYFPLFSRLLQLLSTSLQPSCSLSLGLILYDLRIFGSYSPQPQGLLLYSLEAHAWVDQGCCFGRSGHAGICGEYKKYSGHSPAHPHGNGSGPGFIRGRSDLLCSAHLHCI